MLNLVLQPLQCCSRYLQLSEEEEGAVVQSLCALVLLEGSSPRQVFTRFLLARKVVAVCVCVCVCVCVGGGGGGGGGGRSVKP